MSCIHAPTVADCHHASIFVSACASGQWASFADPLQHTNGREHQSPDAVSCAHTRAYWATFVPLRLILYPVLLVRFWVVLDGFPLWERLLVVGCQLLLCAFNFGARCVACGNPSHAPLLLPLALHARLAAIAWS